MKISELFEAGRVFTLKNPSIKPRGAPEDKARAFDKPGADRSVLKQTSGKGKYHAIEFMDEDDFLSVHVAIDNIDLGRNYDGISVIFFKDGTVDASFSDETSREQWRKDKDKIIAAAKEGLKDAELPHGYDGLMGRSVKLGKPISV